MIVNDDSSVISKWSFKFIDDARVILYNRNMFIIQATGSGNWLLLNQVQKDLVVSSEDVSLALGTVFNPTHPLPAMVMFHYYKINSQSGGKT